MRVVIDTNVIVSAVFFNGLPRKIFEKFAKGNFELFCSEEIFIEYIRVIEDLGKKYGEIAGQTAKKFILRNSTLINVANNDKFSRDPDDDKFINCAIAADAKYLVTGDSDLQVLNKIGTVEIITPKEFFNKI